MRWLPAASAVAVGSLAWAVGVEPYLYHLRQIPIDGVRRGSARERPRPLRILLLADLHYDAPEPRLDRFLTALAETDFDLLVLGGDILGSVDVEDRVVDALDPLLAAAPQTLAVLGTNDMFGPIWRNPLQYLRGPSTVHSGKPLDTARFVANLQSRGVVVLRDETAVVATPAGVVAVGGLDDPHLGLETAGVRQIRCPQAEEAVLRLGLVHAPYVRALDRLTEARYDLILAGHTHGGQVRLPGHGALVSNCDLDPRLARGVHQHGPATVYITEGLGSSTYQPFRFCCRPSAALLVCT